MTPNRFFDPLYGRIEFTGREMGLIYSPEVQRLRYVRMCNINSLLISGASEPSRFEHIVGVMHLAKRWTATNGITGDEAEVFHAAALLHDVQTGPFGHSMEYILADNNVPGDFRHADVAHGSSLKYHQDSQLTAQFAGASFNARDQLERIWARVALTIKGEGLYGQMIAGSVDLDNIDNVVRLAYHVGVATTADARIGLDLADDLRIDDGILTGTSKGIQHLRRWQAVRKDLYSLLLHDWAEFSAKAMLTAAIELAVEHKILNSTDWIMTDDEMIHHLIEKSKGEAQEVVEITRRLRTGDLFEPIALWRTRSIDQYAELSRIETKRSIEAIVRVEIGGRCLVHTILDKGKTERAINIKNRDTGVAERLGDDTREMLVGVFIGKTKVPARARNRAIAAVTAALAQRGLVEMEPLTDPMVRLGDGSPIAQLQLV